MTDRTQSTAAAVAAVVRTEGSRVLATLVRVVGDLGLAEDAVADATLQALRSWQVDGVPDDPRAWLAVVARNKAYDQIRATRRRRTREEHVMQDETQVVAGPDEQRADLLRLLFTSCHPALPMDARVALSLRTLCGLTTHEIAAGLLIEEPTLAKRLVRARRKIADAHIPYRVPGDDELPERLPAVLQVIRLVFTEGHRATSGESLVRVDLCAEAVHLATLLLELMPSNTEVIGLWALLTATHARRATRSDDAGDVILLADQDRSAWDRDAIAVARDAAMGAWQAAADAPGPMLTEAAIAVLHATSPSHDETNWAAIVELYELLDAATQNPIVRLNRAVALAEASGPAVALALLDHSPDRPPGHLWEAVRADLLRRLGRYDEAAVAYRAALAAAPTPPEVRFLTRRLAALPVV